MGGRSQAKSVTSALVNIEYARNSLNKELPANCLVEIATKLERADGPWTDSGTGTAPLLVAEISVHWFLMVWGVFCQSGHWSLVKCADAESQWSDGIVHLEITCIILYLKVKGQQRLSENI